MNFFQKLLSFSIIFLCLSLFPGCQKDVSVENDEEKTFTNYFDVLTDSEGNLVLPLNTTIQLTMTDPKTLEEATAIVEAQLPQWHKLCLLYTSRDRTGNRRFLPVTVYPERAEVHILDDEAAARAYIEQMWAEAMTVYRLSLIHIF